MLIIVIVIKLMKVIIKKIKFCQKLKILKNLKD